MPKPNKFGNRNNWKNDYSEHDYAPRDGRRVTFKPNRQYRKDNTKDWTASVKAHLQDEDIDMGGTSSGRAFNSRKYNNRGGGKNKYVRGSFENGVHKSGKKVLESPTGWYRVTLPYGNKYEKDYVLKMLLEKIAPLPFIPTMWKPQGTSVTFFVDDYKAAEKLQSLHRNIQMPDGFRLTVHVNTGSPHVEMTPELKEKMKLTMAKRYNSMTKALDLSKFHLDPDLQENFCSLSKPVVFLAAVQIIAENIPELEALNLHENKIMILMQVKGIEKKMPNLKILHIGNNKIKDVSMLDAFIGLPILDLVLDGNPLCDKFSDRVVYISEVRKRFPKVVKLDGVDLPPPISFDIQEEAHIPPSIQNFICNPEGQEVVRKFLEQYFLIFDSDSRGPLIQAYHEGAMYSMTSAYPYGHSQKTSNAWLNWYNTDTRNLLKVRDAERRFKLLKQGSVEINNFLKEMPDSKHDMHSFTVDLVLFTPQMLVLTVSGMFKELRSGHKVPPIRYFFRTLVIVPAGAGFCILNEQVHISNATESMAKLAFKTPVIAAPAPPVVPPDVVAGVSNLQVNPTPDITKEQMVQAMAQMSGMNLEWSQKCLEETQWDYNKASIVFTELQKQGSIPAEAFVK